MLVTDPQQAPELIYIHARDKAVKLHAKHSSN